MLATPIVPPVPQNEQKLSDCDKNVDNRHTLPLFMAHNGRIDIANGKVYTFRARTTDDGQRVGRKWKPLGTIASDGTVTPIIKPSLQKEELPYAVDAVRKINPKVRLLNNPAQTQEHGCTYSTVSAAAVSARLRMIAAWRRALCVCAARSWHRSRPAKRRLSPLLIRTQINHAPIRKPNLIVFRS